MIFSQVKEMTRRAMVLSLLLSFVLPLSAQKQISEMREAVEYLASQELGGRFPESKGDTLASTYIVSQLRSLKLKPPCCQATTSN